MQTRIPGIPVLLLAGLLAVATGALAKGTPDGGAGQAAAVRDYLGRDLVFISADPIEKYLTDIAGRLLAGQPGAPPVPRFLIQSTAEFTVFTDVRGNIVVGSEVLRQVESEDELAAALSHELAHVIARHAQTKNVVQKLPFTVESAQLVTIAVDSRGSKGTPDPGRLASFAADTLPTTQAAGTVWSDLIAPGWNRKQEREADLAGVDMVRAAGYDPAAFSSLFTRLDAAQAVRSERVESLRQEALKRAQAKAAGASGTADQILAGLKSGAESGAVEAAFGALARWGTDYDSPEARATAVLEHVQKTSTGRRDKTPRSPRFEAELRQGDGGRLLAADRDSLAVLAALNSKEPRGAGAEAGRLLGDPALATLSPHLNLAIGSWLDTVERQPSEAEQRAIAWSEAELAPRAAYLWRASYQVQRQDYPGALSTLERGADRIDNRSLFLPQMIAAARAGGDLERADALGIECSRVGGGFNLANLQAVAAQLGAGSGAPAKPTGVYADCVAALGYDPVQRRDQALKTQPAAGEPLVPDVGKQLGDKLKGLFGK